jgi:hypothetical protein
MQEHEPRRRAIKPIKVILNVRFPLIRLGSEGPGGGASSITAAFCTMAAVGFDMEEMDDLESGRGEWINTPEIIRITLKQLVLSAQYERRDRMKAQEAVEVNIASCRNGMECILARFHLHTGLTTPASGLSIETRHPKNDVRNHFSR